MSIIELSSHECRKFRQDISTKKDCVDVGVGGAVIISAGGKEIGEPGQKLEAAIQKNARYSGLRIIGPNCVGIMSGRSKLNASFANQMPLIGKMAFISQSGAICTAILDLSIKENIGFSYFVSLGDMLDVDFGDMIDYLGGESEVSSIVMYVESLTNFRKFMSAARAVSRVKPIIVLKAGRTQAGALAAASHTGAMAGEDSVYDAAFQRAGILRVKTFEELFESLSPQSVYRRFFTPMRRLPKSMLARFTQIDYDRHIALVALPEAEPVETMLGVARAIIGRNLKEAEFSVVVSDPWQGKGIGAALLHRCISIAKERGIEKVMGTVLAENTQMLAFGKKLGFKIKKVIGAAEYELSIDFLIN